jgi:hypothetical protein
VSTAEEAEGGVREEEKWESREGVSRQAFSQAVRAWASTVRRPPFWRRRASSFFVSFLSCRSRSALLTGRGEQGKERKTEKTSHLTDGGAVAVDLHEHGELWKRREVSGQKPG